MGMIIGERIGNYALENMWSHFFNSYSGSFIHNVQNQFSLFIH